MKVNRRYKDTVFCDLFGKEERKENALELYNAISGTSYEDPDELEISTLDGVIYMEAKNDVSFVIGDEMVLWEHQSTVNPNMPLRGLMYFGELYSKRLARNRRLIYSTRLVRIPAPQYVVFYNGEEEQPDKMELRLSDAFPGAGDIEVVAHVLNVNAGRNSAIMRRCGALAGYAYLVGLVRERSGRMGPEEAVDTAVAQCIREGVLADYLAAKRSEVVSMILEEYDREETMEMLRQEFREDAIAEGMEKGLAEGREKGLAEGRKQERSLLEARMRNLGLDEDTIRAVLSDSGEQ